MRVSTKTLIFGATALAAGLAAGAALAQSDPVQVGFLTVRSGALAAGGRQMEEGLTLCMKERNYTMAGRKIEVTIADTAGQPALALTKAQELVQRTGAKVLIGPLAAFEALAINDYVKQAQVQIISSSAAAEDMTQRQLNPWFVRAVGTSAQSNHALGEYAAKKLGYKLVTTIADDFAYGHELTAGFQRTFEENGGKIVQKLWPPLNVPDYGTYLAQIKTNVDAVFAGFAGANGLRFLSQFREYGLKHPVLGTMTTVDEGILKNMGDEALGVISAGWYTAAVDTPDNRKFVAAVRAAYGADPGYYTVGAYTACQFLETALTEVKGKIEDKQAFMKALRSVHLTSGPMAGLRLDEYGNPILNVYIRKVERKDGRLVNSVLETYKDVSQFWKYDPKKFLAEPAYSRDNPPARNLEP
jgi:branched-chain amino acid transport system substrate-binding protein